MGHTPFPPREAQNEGAWPPGSQAGAPAGQAWTTSDQHDRLLKGPLAPPRLPNTQSIASGCPGNKTTYTTRFSRLYPECCAPSLIHFRLGGLTPPEVDAGDSQPGIRPREGLPLRAPGSSVPAQLPRWWGRCGKAVISPNLLR